MEVIVNLLQFTGGIILAVGYIPQILKIIKTKSVKDLSGIYLTLMVTGIAFMELYGIYYIKSATMFFVTNTISLTVSTIMFLLYLKYREK